MAIETQFFRSDESETIKLAEQELQWIESTLSEVPSSLPKTVFMHTPLFIDNPNETDSEGKVLKFPF